MIAALLPELVSAQEADHAAAAQASSEDAPHSSYGFWHGFFDAVNPTMNVDESRRNLGARGSASRSAAETQYLHYKFDESRLRYAPDIGKEELPETRWRRGDQRRVVAVSPGNGETHMRASQCGGHHPDSSLMNIFAPIADLDRFTYAKQEHGQDSTAGSTGLSLALRQHKGQTRFY